MRARSALFVLFLSAFSAAFVTACGNGDDRVVTADASTSDGAGGDGAKGEGGSTDGSVSDGDAATTPAADAAQSTLKHIFYIMMENHGYAEIIRDVGAGDAGGDDAATSDGGDAGPAAPYIDSLANQYGLAQNYYGVTHPSLPNYLAAVSGDFQGIWDDCAAGPNVTCAPEEFIPNSGDSTSMQLMTPAQAANATILPHWFAGRNIVDQLEEHGLTWTAYMQSIAGVGDTSEYWPYDTVDGGEAGITRVPRKLYAQKHDPFMYFADIRTNSNRMQRIVPFSQFAADIAGTDVPNFVWISPDQCNDMHGVSADNATALGNPACGGTDSQVIGLGDAFLQTTVPMIMASPAWSEGSAIVIVWDEDDYSGTSGCCKSPTGVDGGVLGGAQVPAIVISSKVSGHQTATVAYNHYSLLATIQRIWGFDCLANTCGMTSADLMTQLFVP